MMKMKKAIALCVMTAMACMIFSGCAKSTNDVKTKAPDEKTQNQEDATNSKEDYKPISISFWNGWTGNDGDVLIDLVEEFNKENPYNITVEMDINSEFQAKFAAACASNEGPDLILGANNYKFLYPDYLVDMNEMFSKKSLKKEHFGQSYLDACTSNEILYVLPFQITGRYMYWNKDLFEAAGLDPEAPPTTYDEWAEYASKISDESKNIYGSGLAYNNIFTNLQIVQRFGGLYISEDGEDGFKANFEGNTGYENFLIWYKNMVDNGDNPVETDTEPMMTAGQIGITSSGGWLKTGLSEAGINYGVSLLPIGEAGEMNPCSVSGFSITEFASPEAKEACQRFVEWWYEGYENTETTGVLKWSLECGYPTFYTPIMDDERYLSSDILSAMTVKDATLDSTYMAPPNFKNTFLLASESINAMIESVITSNINPKEALKEAQKSAEAIIATE